MYDIKIFIENNGTFGARVNAGNEIIYGVGNTQSELMQNLTQGLELAFTEKKQNQKVGNLFNYLYSNNINSVCH